jgi:hypothetical protein
MALVINLPEKQIRPHIMIAPGAAGSRSKQPSAISYQVAEKSTT